MSPEYAAHDFATDVASSHNVPPDTSSSAIPKSSSSNTYAQSPRDGATLPDRPGVVPHPYATTALNDSDRPHNDASENIDIESQLILPPSTNLRPNPAPPPLSVLKGWFPRDKKPATMFDLAIVSSYRPPSTELSMIVASPGVSADEKGHDLGLEIAPPVYAKRMAEVAEV